MTAEEGHEERIDHPDVAPPPAPKTERSPTDASPKSRRDLFAALASGFVAAMALAVSMYNVYLQHQQIRAQVWPHLTVGFGFSDGMTLIVANRGVGPAELKRVRVLVDGVAATDWPDVWTKLLPKGRTVDGDVSSIEGSVFGPGVERTAFRVRDDSMVRSMMAERRRLAVELCYCSILDECWIAKSVVTGMDKTESVASCPQDPTPFRAVSEEALDRQWGLKDGGGE